MNQYGKTIRIYLKDRTATGIKICELVNSTIQAISCPRTRMGELKKMDEANRPAVYFLFGYDETTNHLKAYIGEAESIGDRLQQQLLDKSFWNEVIFFGSKDLNITKAHVKYLESKLIHMAFKAERYTIANNNVSQPSSLPLPDVDAMEEFLENLKLMLGTLGHNILEPLLQHVKTSIVSENPVHYEIASNNLNGTELFLSVKNIKASAILTDEGIVVLKGSQAELKNQSSLSNGYRGLKEYLIENKILIINESYFEFHDDYLFKSASQAAAVIVGTAINGRDYWKTRKGITLNNLEN